MANVKTTKSSRTTVKKAPTSVRTTKAVKKDPTKKAVRTPAKNTSTRSLHEEVETSRTAFISPKPSAVRFKKSYAIIGLAVLLLLAALYAGRSYLVAATVNGEPISRLALISELEKQSGKQTLDTMVTKTLILQEAKKQNIEVTDQQINDEIKKIEDNLKQQGQELDQVLAMQGLTRESLKDQVKVQKIVEVLLGRQIVVTQKEVDDYIASNSASLPQDVPAETTKQNVEQSLRQQKLGEKFQTWLQDLRQKAQVTYMVNY